MYECDNHYIEWMAKSQETNRQKVKSQISVINIKREEYVYSKDNKFKQMHPQAQGYLSNNK